MGRPWKSGTGWQRLIGCLGAWQVEGVYPRSKSRAAEKYNLNSLIYWWIHTHIYIYIHIYICLSPEQVACHSGRTTAPTDCSEPFSSLICVHVFFEIGRLLILKSAFDSMCDSIQWLNSLIEFNDSIHRLNSMIQFNVRFEIASPLLRNVLFEIRRRRRPVLKQNGKIRVSGISRCPIWNRKSSFGVGSHVRHVSQKRHVWRLFNSMIYVYLYIYRYI